MSQTSPSRDEQAVRQFVERFGAVMAQAGVPPMPARVFAALLATDSGRLTAAELSSLLEASPAAISGAVRYLVPLGLVSRERMAGSRRDVYRVHDDVWYEMALRQDQVLARWVATTQEGMTALGPGTPAGRRVAEAREFFQFYLDEAPAMLARWREHVARWREHADGQASAPRSDADG